MEQTSLLSGSVWLSLPQETRAKIAELFDIKKSGNVYVVNGANGAEVQSDGYTYKDLSVITLERMQEITGSKSENFYHLFKNIVAIVQDEVPLEELIETVEEVILDNLEQEMEESTPTKEVFCRFCDSKGVRHKKVCTRPL